MGDTYAYQPAGLAARDRATTLFARTMGYVAATTGLFALGAYLGRNMPSGIALIAYFAAFAALIAMQFSVRKSQQATVAQAASSRRVSRKRVPQADRISSTQRSNSAASRRKIPSRNGPAYRPTAASRLPLESAS